MSATIEIVAGTATVIEVGGAAQVIEVGGPQVGNVFGADIEVLDAGSGVVLRDSNGARRRLRVDTDGTVLTEVLAE